MSYSTDVETIKAAKKPHICSWCDKRIETGEGYKRWRWYDSGDAMTCKLHPECYVAMGDLEYGETFYPGENPRGCSCGHTAGCENCASIKAVHNAE